MRSHLGFGALIGLGLALSAAPLPAQYAYPGGYGGFPGWGATTVAGSHAAGMGMFAAGAGAYNEQTAQARSINAQTAMQANEYLYQSQQRRNRTYYSRLAKEQAAKQEAGEEIFRRIHDNPTPRDVHTGDALNAILDDLENPKVFPEAVRAASQQPVPSALVRSIPFGYAPQAIAISLEDLSGQGVPDILLTNPAFEEDRKAIRALAADARKQLESPGQVSPETLAGLRQAIKAAQAKVKTVIPANSADHYPAENYLKALFGLTKMLQQPNTVAFLEELKKIDTTSMAHLLSFMHSFNLRFTPAKTPDQERAYDQLFTVMSGLRDQLVRPGQAPSPFQVPDKPADPNKLTNYFSGMAMSHFEPQTDPHTGQTPPPPPAPEGAQPKGARLKGALQKKAAGQP